MGLALASAGQMFDNVNFSRCSVSQPYLENICYGKSSSKESLWIRVANKNWKFCDSGQIMGEVIIKCFSFTIFDFINPTIQRCPKTQTKNTLCACADFSYRAQPIRNAAETYNVFFRGIFGWVKIWKMI